MGLEKNNRYSYSCFGHVAIPDAEGRYYCRARNHVMNDDMWLCQNCPLLGGSVLSPSGQEYPECWYYDLETGPEQISDSFEEDCMAFKKKIDGMIESGFVTDFPEYLSDEDSIRAFGNIEKALIFAGEKHKNQTRKGSMEPYICHPVEVMMITARMTRDNEVIMAAALHDTLEDTDTSIDELVQTFGQRVADLVRSESEDKREGKDKSETWKVRKEETIAHARTASLESKIILLADKLSNLRATKREMDNDNPNVWERFNVKDPAMHKWYFTELLKTMDELKDTAQYAEYRMLLHIIFGD